MGGQGEEVGSHWGIIRRMGKGNVVGGALEGQWGEGCILGREREWWYYFRNGGIFHEWCDGVGVCLMEFCPIQFLFCSHGPSHARTHALTTHTHAFYVRCSRKREQRTRVHVRRA